MSSRSWPTCSAPCRWSAFLVVAHVAMIAGMLDPAVMGWTQGGGQHEMPGGTMMPGMHH